MMSEVHEPFLVGITAGWLHPDADRTLYNGRCLLYVELSMGEWFLKSGSCIPVMIPGARPELDVSVSARDFAKKIDGLVLQGGVDMAPESYGQTPLRPEWSGDRIRDRYELDLLEACLALDRPILAICRGHQVLNVGLGGTLLQDISSQKIGALNHRDSESYHENIHEVVFDPSSELKRLYGRSGGMINSVHHQAIDELGSGLSVEAVSPEDGIIEAVRLQGDRYAVGVQWHPEFQESHQSQLLSTRPLMDDFINAMRQRKAATVARRAEEV